MLKSYKAKDSLSCKGSHYLGGDSEEGIAEFLSDETKNKC